MELFDVSRFFFSETFFGFLVLFLTFFVCVCICSSFCVFSHTFCFFPFLFVFWPLSDGFAMRSPKIDFPQPTRITNQISVWPLFSPVFSFFVPRNLFSFFRKRKEKISCLCLISLLRKCLAFLFVSEVCRWPHRLRKKCRVGPKFLLKQGLAPGSHTTLAFR